MRNSNLKTFPKGYWRTPSIILSSKLKALYRVASKQVSKNFLGTAGLAGTQSAFRRAAPQRCGKYQSGHRVENRNGLANSCWRCVFLIRAMRHSTSAWVVGKETGPGLQQMFMNPKEYIARSNQKCYHFTAIRSMKALVCIDENCFFNSPSTLFIVD